jgi:hypothetical protein
MQNSGERYHDEIRDTYVQIPDISATVLAERASLFEIASKSRQQITIIFYIRATAMLDYQRNREFRSQDGPVARLAI